MQWAAMYGGYNPLTGCTSATFPWPRNQHKFWVREEQCEYRFLYLPVHALMDTGQLSLHGHDQPQ